MRSKINYYSAKRLYENGIEQDGMLVCNKIVSDYSLIAVNDREDCHLFDQTRKALGTNIDLNKVFIILDFKDVIFITMNFAQAYYMAKSASSKKISEINFSDSIKVTMGAADEAVNP